MQKMVAPGNHNCYTFPGRKSRQDPGSILAQLHNQERLTGSYIGSYIGSYLGARLVGSYIREAKLVGSYIGSYQKGKLVGSCTTILQK